ATAPGGAASAAPAPRPASEIPVRLPADIMYRRAADSDTIVVFSHATHAAAAENRCVTCHPQTFHLLSRGPAPTHADMNAGRSCGICHDGHKTFAVADSGACQMCHVSQRARLAAAARAVDGATGAGGTTAGRSVPAPHVYPRSADSPGAVTFKHATHRGLSGGCAACHPKLFKMAAEPPRPGGGMHESAACGSCHDGARTFATDDAASCARCHVEAGGSR
ncbi:MAG TPA: c(7)-type cytochrome triheme domain-containing protein, partial [Candidatus Eisenbacteria bacterium]